MEGNQFVNPDLYAQQVAQASGGAMPAAGMAPYPLYGIPPLGQATTPAAGAEAEVPVYRRNWFWALVGAGSVGAAWAYFGWWTKRGVKSNPAGGDGEDTPDIRSVLTRQEREDCAELWGKERLTPEERRRLRDYERKLCRSPY